MGFGDPRPFPPEFEQQDYPKIIYKQPQTKVDYNPDLALKSGEDFFIANNAEEEANPPWGKPAGWSKDKDKA